MMSTSLDLDLSNIYLQIGVNPRKLHCNEIEMMCISFLHETDKRQITSISDLEKRAKWT